MAINERGYRHDHRILRRKRGEWAFNEAAARSSKPDRCMECWALSFQCPCCGPCVNAMVTTAKTCAFCGEGLLRLMNQGACRVHTDPAPA